MAETLEPVELDSHQSIDCISEDLTPDIASAVNNLALQLATLENLMIYDSKGSQDKTKEATEKAAAHLSEMLWTKPFSPVPIIDLFRHKSLAPVEIQMVCGSTPEDFIEFLKECKDFFIVTGEHVLPRKNIPKKDWAPSYKAFDEGQNNVVLNFFKSYTSHGKPVLVEKLYNEVGKHFSNNSGEGLFSSFEELSRFLGMFPDVFYVHEFQVVNILINSNFDQESLKEVRKTKSGVKQPVVIPEVVDIDSLISDETLQLRKDIINKTQFITDLKTCQMQTKKILENENVISLDCEGYKLGATGMLSLIQIGIKSGEVYVFDILTVPQMMNEGNLRDIFESKDIIKVLHDCRNDASNIYHEYKVNLCNIYDTRIAHELIINKSNVFIGLNNLCQTYKAPINFEKDKFKKLFKSNPSFWLDRPLSESSLVYAALDASCIMEAYKNLEKKLSLLERDVIKLSEKASLVCR